MNDLNGSKPKISVRNLNFHYGGNHALRDNNLDIAENRVTAIIGPSGCGKSTHLRCYNRIYELYKGQSASGEILLDDRNILDPSVDLIELRMRVGMIFQRPSPFPMSIYDNVAYGLRLQGGHSRSEMEGRIEDALRNAALWDEVENQLHEPGTHLSGGQQQRLCIARAIAVEPEVILMDEPASAIDPVGTAKIEDLIGELKTRYTIVIVTHNMQQAARVSDLTAFFFEGEIVEFGAHNRYLHKAETQADRRLHHRKVRIMTTHLQKEIEKLQKRILFMGAEVEDTVRKSVDALVRRDAKLAQAVIDHDEEIDQLEIEIEEECLKILALHQPVAIDLRYVIAVLKMNNDLERIGDLAVDIAERAAYLGTHSPIDLLLDFRGMADLTQLMLKCSLDALVNSDPVLARQVRASDDAVDEMNREMFTLIHDYIRNNPDHVAEAIHLLSASRHLERIADQTTNIAEDVIYMVEGEIVRHQPESYRSDGIAPSVG